MENKNIKILSSFPPIVDERSRILILGTMPGVQSLRMQQYYAYKHNHFWGIMYALFGKTPDEDYEHRKLFLLEHNIALWDVLKYCEREGSLDSDIKNPVPNDFAGLFEDYPGIGTVFFNGGNSENFFKRYVKRNIDTGGIQFHGLPSTSPANARPFEEKLEKWKYILETL